MKKFIRFYFKASIINKLKILRSLFAIPALVFHELCHYVFIIGSGRIVIEQGFVYFYRITINENLSESLDTYSYSITHRGNYIPLIVNLISIAPVIGFVGSFMIIPQFPYLFIYLLLCYKTALLSEADFKVIRDNSNILMTKPINKFVKRVLVH
jgi:hypothetical protein